MIICIYSVLPFRLLIPTSCGSAKLAPPSSVTVLGFFGPILNFVQHWEAGGPRFSLFLHFLKAPWVLHSKSGTWISTFSSTGGPMHCTTQARTWRPSRRRTIPSVQTKDGTEQRVPSGSAGAPDPTCGIGAPHYLGGERRAFLSNFV